jgi:teichuronic acid biosynthesis protein TuaE
MSTPAATSGPAGGAAGVRPPIAAIAGGAVLAGALAVWQPLIGIAIALVALGMTLVRRVPVRDMAPLLVVLVTLAAIGGPNLAAPGLGEVFLFRVLIVLMGLGLAGYLLMDGRLTLPAGLLRPAGILAAWFAWTALSIGWASNVVAAVRWTSFMAMMAGMALAIALYCGERRRAKIMLWSLLGAFVVAGLVAVAELTTGMHLPTFRAGSESQRLIGVGSLFGNQNNFATFLGLSLPFLVTLPLIYRDVRLRAVGVVGAAASLGFILLTGSKSGLLSAAFVLVGLIVLAGSDRRTRRRLFAAVGVVGLAAAIVIPSLQGGGIVRLDERTITKLDFSTLLTQIETGTGSGAVRAGLLVDGLGLVASTDGLGVGAGNAETRVHELGPVAPRVPNLHNWWLEVLVNGGVVGFALYLWFYFTLIRRQSVVVRTAQDPLIRYMAMSGALAMIGWIAGSIGPSTAIHFAPMWIVFGLSMGALVLGRKEASRSAY